MQEFELTVQPDWIDYNGHMNVAYYVLAFDQATDAIYERWQIGEAYAQRGYSLFTLAMNVDYLAEVVEGEQLKITTQLLDADHKRILYFHRMFHADNGHLVATNECLCMNVDMKTRRSAGFAAPLAQSFQNLLNEHRKLPQPENAGRRLEIRRRPATQNEADPSR